MKRKTHGFSLVEFLIVIGILGLVGTLMYWAYSVSYCTERILTVKQIGLCSTKDGLCRVFYDDGTAGLEYLPFEGQRVQVCRK